MTVVGLQGLQGGVGTTSIIAGLAWSLAKLGERVLAVDLNPDNMLRLHFNMPFESSRGWARAELDGSAWQSSAMRYETNLDFLPFGQLSLAELTHWSQHAATQSDYWLDKLNALKGAGEYQWILLDMPFSYPENHIALVDAVDTHITIITPTMNNHVRLHQQTLPTKSQLLINKLSTSSQLQQDIHLLWQQGLQQLIPLIIHLDEAVAESFADKKSVGEYSEDSLAAGELLTLANWCLIHRAEQPS